MSNRIITTDDEKSAGTHKAELAGFTETVRKMADFDFHVSVSDMTRQVPFILFLCLLVILFIYNGHNAEKTIRETEKMNREIKELRSEYISVLSELMSQSKQSEIAKRLETEGISEIKNPPRKITVNGD